MKKKIIFHFLNKEKQKMKNHDYLGWFDKLVLTRVLNYLLKKQMVDPSTYIDLITKVDTNNWIDSGNRELMIFMIDCVLGGNL